MALWSISGLDHPYRALYAFCLYAITRADAVMGDFSPEGGGRRRENSQGSGAVGPLHEGGNSLEDTARQRAMDEKNNLHDGFH